MHFKFKGRDFSLFGDIAQWKKFFGMLSAYFFKYTTIIAIIMFFICCVCVWKSKGKRKSNGNLEKRICFGAYIIIMLSFSILNREVGENRVLRLSFDSWTAGDSGFHESNVLTALFDGVYFMPYGIIVRWQNWGNNRLICSLLCVLITGFIIEFLQYLLYRGVASVEDLFAYVIGGSVGIAVSSIYMKINQ